ncbi:MAG: hypothetical protein AABX00_04600 [Nanoarchaeota archaeon]
MMQARDWIIGLIGVAIGALGVLSLMGMFDLPRALMLWIAAIAGFILLYASIVEITNSNVMGTVSLIAGLVILLISFLPVLNDLGAFGTWASFSWIGDVIYKIVLVIEGIFLAMATFAMEL